MKKALLLLGKIETGEEYKESYQLIFGINSSLVEYYGREERNSFYEKISKDFVENMLKSDSSLEIQIFNGARINIHTGEGEKISELEGYLKESFSEKLYEEMRKNSLIVLFPPSNN